MEKEDPAGGDSVVSLKVIFKHYISNRRDSSRKSLTGGGRVLFFLAPPHIKNKKQEVETKPSRNREARQSFP